MMPPKFSRQKTIGKLDVKNKGRIVPHPFPPHHNLSIYTYRVLFLSLDILYTLVSANVKLFNLFKESLRVREREGERNEKNSNTISEVYLLRYFREIAAL